MEPRIAPSIAWCTDARTAAELAQFFVDNVDPSYISHSELQGPRALDANHWAPDLFDVVRREIEQRVNEGGGRISATAVSYPIFVVRKGSAIIGLGMVSLFPLTPAPYALIEDIVVARTWRNAGIGRDILDWLTAESSAVGCVRLFLESGVENARAHEFFKREGFTTCSVVMMKSIARKG